MLYMSKSTAKFARSKGEQHMPGTRWCYHSGATNVSWPVSLSCRCFLACFCAILNPIRFQL